MGAARTARTIVRVITLVVVVTFAALVGSPLRRGPNATPEAGAAATGIHMIKHVIVIMQENRSFDDYFGTYPGADGIPKKNCNPNPEIVERSRAPLHGLGVERAVQEPQGDGLCQ
jgi:phospholipase C